MKDFLLGLWVLFCAPYNLLKQVGKAERIESSTGESKFLKIILILLALAALAYGSIQLGIWALTEEQQSATRPN